jgi:hypothetical protein
VAVGAGVSVAGIGVGRSVVVEEGKGAGVEVAGWQAVMRKRHPRRSFFMMLIKTQLPGALFQTIEINKRNTRRN